MWTDNERAAMRRALALAEQGRGRVAPNPMVGAVLLVDGRPVAEGWHHQIGHPHAEVDCLRGLPSELTASPAASLVVTLEPCDHQGRTPPCTGLILRQGIPRVVVAMEDPNPRVAGQGLARLREAGVAVECGLLAEEARQLNRGFVTHMTQGRPWITLKWAASLDGRISAERGRPTTLSGSEARLATARLRSRHTGILVGSGTAAADDPRLDLRGQPGRPPVAIVLDSYARLPLDSQLVRQARRRSLIVACGRLAPLSAILALEQAGAIVLRNGMADRPPLDWLLELLPARGVDSLLVEGGAAVHGAFLAAGLADELVCVIAAGMLGRGLPPVEHATLSASRWRLLSRQALGEDEWQVWRPIAERS